MRKKRLTGRDREVAVIHEANRAAAVGRLMLGEVKNWQEFMEADRIDLKNLPRRQLKSGKSDIQKRLAPELTAFCAKNFHGMDVPKLSQLYEEIKASRGLEIPLQEFNSRFAPVRKEVLRGNPAHLTLAISLWGLQMKFPEDELSKDVAQALEMAKSAEKCLADHEKKSHAQRRLNRPEIQSLLKEKLLGSRSALIACFNLMEAYLNGIAWDFLQSTAATISNRRRKLLDDSASVSIRDKILKYPEIITGRSPWAHDDVELQKFLDIVKPFRDSLVHPSPFSAPARFGGYDKLRLLYRIDFDTAQMTFNLTISLIEKIHRHIHGDDSSVPNWLTELIYKQKNGETKNI